MSNQTDETLNFSNDESWGLRNELESDVMQKISYELWKRYNTEFLQKGKEMSDAERDAIIAEVFAQFKDELDAEDEKMRAARKHHL